MTGRPAEQVLADNLHAEAADMRPAERLEQILAPSREQERARTRALQHFSDDELKEAGRMAVERIETQTGAAGATAAPEQADQQRGSSAMATTIGGTSEDVSITGTGISHVALNGSPEFTGLISADDAPYVRVEDGALCIEVGDLDTAIAWRNAWQHAVSHLVMHKERKAGRR